MKRALVVSMSILLVGALLCSVSCVAQDPEYSLKDYMPQTVGSKWTMKSADAEGDRTVTYEVLEARDLDGQEAMPIVARTPEGTVSSGTMESVTAERLTIFGAMFARRGAEGGGRPVTVRYQPPASFPGKMRVGQSEEISLKAKMGERQFDITMKLQLAAVETVTVPKGTFEDCLKLVYTTSYGRGEMTRTIWYAKGVGMVKRERSGRRGAAARVSELTDYALAK